MINKTKIDVQFAYPRVVNVVQILWDRGGSLDFTRNYIDHVPSYHVLSKFGIFEIY